MASPHDYPGVFITLDGGDGSGKSTVAARLAEILGAAGRDVVQTREPGGCPIAEMIRSIVVSGEPGALDPMSEWLLFAAARLEHTRQVIIPALTQGQVVICDRWLLSTLAYQGAAGGIDPDDILRMHDATTGGLHADISLVLQVPTEVGLQRSGKRLAETASQEDRFESKGSAFHAAVTRGLIKHVNNIHRPLVIDAAAPIDEVLAIATSFASKVVADKLDLPISSPLFSKKPAVGRSLLSPR